MHSSRWLSMSMMSISIASQLFFVEQVALAQASPDENQKGRVGWKELTPDIVANKLKSFIGKAVEEGEKDAIAVSKIVDTSLPLTIVKNYPKLPYLVFQFGYRGSQDDQASKLKEVTQFVTGFLEQHIISQDAIDREGGENGKLKQGTVKVDFVAKGPGQKTDGRWNDIDPKFVADKLHDWIKSGAARDDGPSIAVAKIIDISLPPTISKNFPESPYLVFTFRYREGVTNQSGDEFKITQLVERFLEQDILTQEAIKSERGVDGKLKRGVFEIRIEGTDKTSSPFQSPQGLSMPASQLLQLLGYSTCQDAGCFPFTVEECLHAGVKAYQLGLYQDSKALAEHALSSQKRPEILFLKGTSEIALGQCDSALATARTLRPLQRTAWYENLRVRIGGPIAVRFEILLKDIQANPPTQSSTRVDAN